MIIKIPPNESHTCEEQGCEEEAVMLIPKIPLHLCREHGFRYVTEVTKIMRPELRGEKP